VIFRDITLLRLSTTLCTEQADRPCVRSTSLRSARRKRFPSSHTFQVKTGLIHLCCRSTLRDSSMWLFTALSIILSVFTQQRGSLLTQYDSAPIKPDVAHLDIPVKQPLYAEALDPNLIAFSIEADRWPDWAGYEVGEPNAYARQLFDNLQKRTGHPPAVRVGGDPI